MVITDDKLNHVTGDHSVNIVGPESLTHMANGRQGVSRCRTRDNLRNPLRTGDKVREQGIHPGFKTQGRLHQKSKIGVTEAP